MDETAFKKQIGLKIRQLRTIKGWSRQQVADKLEMSPTAYGNMERGETDVCITRLAHISEILEIPLPDLLGVTEKTVYNFTGIRNTECLIGVGQTSNNITNEVMKHELEKSNLLLKAREKEVEYLEQQIMQLQKIIDLMSKSDK